MGMMHTRHMCAHPPQGSVNPRFVWLAREIPGFFTRFNLVFYMVLPGFYHVFSQVPNPRFPGFSMITSAFPQDSEVPVFQKSQVSCQALSLQKNLGFYLVFTRYLPGFLPGFFPGYNHRSLPAAGASARTAFRSAHAPRRTAPGA